MSYSLSLRQLAEAFAFESHYEATEEIFAGVSSDTRSLHQGELFFALNGERFKGSDFVEQALEKKAVAVVLQVESDEEKKHFLERSKTEPLYIVRDSIKALGALAAYRRKNHMGLKVLAITGSSGKTSCKAYCRELLKQKYAVHATEKNYNNWIGAPMTILQMPEETEVLVLELGMNHGGELAWLSEMSAPDLTAITNLQSAHIGNFANGMEGIRDAKAEIFTGQKKDSPAFLPVETDLEMSLHSIARANSLEALSFVEQVEVLQWQTTVNEKGLTTTYTLKSALGELGGSLPLVGSFHQKNVQLAVAVAGYFALDRRDIQAGLDSLESPEKRFEILSHKPLIINDAYNANPASMKAALESLAGLTIPNCSWHLVLGDMFELGTQSREAHEALAAILEELSKKVSLKYVLLCGESMAYAYAIIQKNLPVRHFKSSAEAFAFLNTVSVSENSAWLFKASNGMGFLPAIEDWMQ